MENLILLWKLCHFPFQFINLDGELHLAALTPKQDLLNSPLHIGGKALIEPEIAPRPGPRC